MHTQPLKRFAIGAGAVVLGGVYWFPFRRWFRHWGATPEEVARGMAGDALEAKVREFAKQTKTTKRTDTRSLSDIDDDTLARSITG